MRHAPLLLVYHDLSIPDNPALGRLVDDIDPDVVAEMYYRYVVGETGLPIRSRNANRVVWKGRVYSPHYNTYYYYYRGMFNDGLPLRKLTLYPPWRRSEIESRIVFARERLRYFRGQLLPGIVRWLDNLWENNMLEKRWYPKLRSHAIVLLNELDRDDLVELIEDYIESHYSAFLAAERYGVKSGPVEQLMKVFRLGFDDVATTYAPQVAMAIIQSVNLHLGFKNSKGENIIRR